jgi:RNA polymerase sigma-70 factor (ECF subfamily)
MSAESDLVEAVLARRAGAFERLVREYQGLVGHIVFRLVRQPDDAKELCQETFLRVYRSLHQFRSGNSLKAWIGRVAYTIALRHLEKRRLAPDASVRADDAIDAIDRAAAMADAESTYAERETAEHIRAAMNALPPVQRMLVSLYHLEEISIPEISVITGLPAGTIKSHLFRTRRELRRLIEDRLGIGT